MPRGEVALILMKMELMKKQTIIQVKLLVERVQHLKMGSLLSITLFL